jgi:Rieske Fe-S protein
MSRIPVETRTGLGRRQFVKLCAAAAATASAAPEVLARAGSAPLKRYARVQLVDGDGEPLRAAALEAGQTYVFNYPFVTTPCFLIDLGRPVAGAITLRTEAGESYRWPGGIGPRASLVSFSAICAHKMSHPAKSVSFINYRHEAVSFRDHQRKLVKRESVIFCCSEKSVYDPGQGAAVLGGPAKQPLCTILLEHDPRDDGLHAVGSYGGEMFERFFASFTPRLQLEWGKSNVSEPATGACRTVPIESYSRTQMLCGG